MLDEKILILEAGRYECANSWSTTIRTTGINNVILTGEEYCNGDIRFLWQSQNDYRRKSQQCNDEVE